MNNKQIKQQLIEIYNRKEYQLYNTGMTNDGKWIIYKNIEIISFIKYFTRLLAYGSKTAEEYINDDNREIVNLTESMINDDINNMEKCKTIEEAIDKLLNCQSNWILYWKAKEVFPYVLEQIYLKNKLDKKIWGW